MTDKADTRARAADQSTPAGKTDTPATHSTSEEAHLGAVEGDRPTDRPQQGNANAPALDEQGMPKDCDKIAQDVIGATEDETQG